MLVSGVLKEWDCVGLWIHLYNDILALYPTSTNLTHILQVCINGTYYVFIGFVIMIGKLLEDHYGEYIIHICSCSGEEISKNVKILRHEDQKNDMNY